MYALFFSALEALCATWVRVMLKESKIDETLPEVPGQESGLVYEQSSRSVVAHDTVFLWLSAPELAPASPAPRASLSTLVQFSQFRVLRQCRCYHKSQLSVAIYRSIFVKITVNIIIILDILIFRKYIMIFWSLLFKIKEYNL